MPSDPEQKFHSLFYSGLFRYVENNDTKFDSVSIEKNIEGRRADIHIESNITGSLVIEVKRDDISPYDKEVVKQARDYARDVGADFFATCNSKDFYLFNYDGQINIKQIPYNYANLRDISLSDATLNGFVPQLLSAVDHLFQKGKLPNQEETERIVGLLRTFHSAIWPAYKELAKQKYGSNEKFINIVDSWINENDYSNLDQDEQFEIAAKQHAYLLTNKILFYEVVREQTPSPIETNDGNQLDSLVGPSSLDFLAEHIRRRFDDIIEQIDYKPIFNNSEIFDEFPDNKKTLEHIQSLTESIEQRKISGINEDLLGDIFEELIPEGERKKLGQYYTPPTIAEAVSQWVLDANSKGKEPRILDPASGSGTFPVKIYNEIRHQYPELSHQNIVDLITSVDINKFPLHLTALNLASQNIEERIDRIHAYHTSFFNLDPETAKLASARLDEESTEELGYFNGVIGNPPYIRNKNIPDKAAFRSHLSEFGPTNRSPYLDGSKKISKKSDAYVYFITKGTQFLQEGGRLGYVIPPKWLTARYGLDLQQFLFDHYRIEAVVSFAERAFEDAFVDTCLLFVERCEDEESRQETVTKFIRVREEIEPEDLYETVTYGMALDQEPIDIRDRPNYRMVGVRQGYLHETGPKKMSYYLNAPLALINLIERTDFVPLKEFADISYGQKTGANRFFILDEEEAERRGIDERFLSPVVKSIKGMDSIVFNNGDSDKFMLDVHDYVQQVDQRVRDFGSDTDLEEEVKSALQRDGYDGLLAYLREGEDDGIHERSTCASRPVWFNLGEQTPPELFHPKFFKWRLFTVWNRAGALTTNAVDCVHVKPNFDSKVVIGLMNSSLYAALLECWGRVEGNGALQLMTYELKSVPVPDIRKFDQESKERIKEATELLLDGEDNAREKLNKAVLDAVGIDSISPNKLEDMRKAMTHQRLQGEFESEVLLKDVDAVTEWSAEYFTADDREKTLDDFK
ncbi:N-6 DNA methylase [Natronolimnohabitans sp. A-GB9]|uniref:Eco57I restriction-modification methylase domain-containing protein n=1 Tax=Natronolimnohabitans sp. A-GB9 TaxID=3069757 RepID=UPI0027B7F490|nr:N-6 DNA methylase [Natronolimnohabitans sp. A-GB9]MDQ2051683.1 N-6 DNA methylase [Natronolimnohabitans sp. A-GB9]